MSQFYGKLRQERIGLNVSRLKDELFVAGVERVKSWCVRNSISIPMIEYMKDEPDFGTCAYYRNKWIYIWVQHCASIGYSYPGYVVDRTPYGVLCHELGHHVDKAHGASGGIVASKLRRATGEKPITSYCPNDNEWFAEIFRLFVTNPSLLKLLRPKSYRYLDSKYFSVETKSWRVILKDSPRHYDYALSKILKA